MSDDQEWVDDPHPEEGWVDDKPVSTTESGLRGLAQGASLGFADELTGGAEALWEKAKGNPEEFGRLYEQARNESRENYAKAKTANPGAYTTGEVGGGIATAFVPGLNVAKGANLAKLAGQAALQGGLMGAGYSEADNAGDIALDAAKGAALGGTLGAGGGYLAQKATPLIKGIGNKLGETAEKLAVNATGATGKQASEFADDAGRQLLDRGLVRFGDTPEKIAQRTSGAMDSATSAIDTALKDLDAKGVSISTDSVVSELESQIAALKRDPSQAGAARKLVSVVEDIRGSGDASVPVGSAEKIKRGFNKMAGNWMDPEVGQAGKAAYGAYKDAVETAAEAADPQLSKMFTEGKSAYGLLAPINEAAERRSLQQRQSPWGGLSDLVAGGGGAAAAGPLGAVTSMIGKRVLAPRATSSAAVGLDKVSKMLMRSPKMADLYNRNPQVFSMIAQKMEQKLSDSGAKVAEKDSKPYDKNTLLEKTQGSKYHEVLQNAAKRGDRSTAATNFILQQTDPNYRKLILDEDKNKEEQPQEDFQ